MGSIIRYIILTAMRDMLFIGLLVIVAAATGISFMLGSTALVEQQQMSLTYIAGSVRMILVVGNILFICFHIRRAFENKEIDLTLSRPISRTSFMIAYWLGFTILAFMLTIPAIAVMAIVTTANVQGLLFWGFTLLCEMALVAAFALVSALIMQSAVTSALSCLAFYLLGRMMGFFILTVKSAPIALSGGVMEKIVWVMSKTLVVISCGFPRLDLFGKTSWLLYGMQFHDVYHRINHDLWIAPLQTLIYIPLLLSVAIFDFKRKQF